MKDKTSGTLIVEMESIVLLIIRSQSQSTTYWMTQNNPAFVSND